VNYVDHTLTDQTSVLRFIEDNWLKGERIGGGSFDALAGTLNNMFYFHWPNQRNPHAARSFNRFDVKLTALKNIAGGSKNNRSGCPRFAKLTWGFLSAVHPSDNTTECPIFPSLHAATFSNKETIGSSQPWSTRASKSSPTPSIPPPSSPSSTHCLFHYWQSRAARAPI